MRACGVILAVIAIAHAALAQVAVRAGKVHTMSGPPIDDGVVVVTDGKIAAVGPAAQVIVPDGYTVLEAAVVTPGLIDARSTVGLTGIYNQAHDQDQLERSAPIQPELSALDAYNAEEPLIGWVRGFGVTTLHTGHAPGELISGQTFIVKTRTGAVQDAVIVPAAAVAATLGESARKGDGKSPGTRAKMVSMLRAELIRAQEYASKQALPEEDKRPARDLRLEALARVLSGELPLMVHAHRAQDIASALRVAREFNLKLWLDGASEAYRVLEEIQAAGVPVIVHPIMQRPVGEAENMSWETAAALRAVGIPIALQSGFESYVPKTRVVLLEAAIAAANGLTFDQALAAITIDAARILGIDQRVGSLEVGKDGDLALYDGDPFEYTTHCVGVVIEGQVVSDETR